MMLSMSNLSLPVSALFTLPYFKISSSSLCLEGEIILMSCKVTKFNKYNWQQERNLIITNANIYNFKQKSKKMHLKCRGEEDNTDR